MSAWIPNDGAQHDFAHDWSNRYIALEGGWSAGKTWIGARKTVTAHLMNALDADGNPNGLGINSAVVAPSYGNAADFDIPELQTALDEANIASRFDTARSRFILTDLGTKNKPSCILVRSADNPTKIAGWQAPVLWLDEPTRFRENHVNPTLDPFIQLLGRNRHPDANILLLLMTYTNEGDQTRIHIKMHAGLPGHKLYTAPTKQNLHAAQFYEDMLLNLDDELKEQYLDGNAISLRGRCIYYIFSEDQNVNSELVLAPELPLQLSLDFNINPGMHAEIGQYHTSKDMFTVTHEIHEKSMSVRELVPWFKHWVDKQGGFVWPELQIFGDASGNSRWTGTGETDYSILADCLNQMDIDYRICVPRANPHVVDRFNAMNTAFRDLSGNVHWQCHPRCKRLIHDLKNMKRNMEGNVDKSDQLMSHASDAEGYRVFRLRPVRNRTTTVEDQKFNV